MSRYYFWLLATALGLGFGSAAHAQFFITPSLGAGYNTQQGNYYSVGVDAGVNVDEHLYGGVGVFFAAGQHPTDDREIGGGPFVGWVQPIVSFLSAQIREDIDYVDVRSPYLASVNPDVYTHSNIYGIESATYLGLHVAFTRNFGISAGYRAVLGLSNNDIAKGRSGFAFGLTLGF